MTRTPSYILHDGFRMPMGFPVESFQSALGYRARPGDIFVSAYPKCGTTWMQNIVWLVLHRGDPLPAGARMTEAIPHLEEVGREAVERLPEPRVIKTHLPFALTPTHPEGRVIYVSRNPFDCAVSYYHHTRGFVHHYDFAEGTFDDYFECFLAGEVDFGDYFDNVSSWLAHRGEPGFLFLTYEHMQADPVGAVVAVGDFLGPELGGTVHDEAILDRILEHSSFAAMSRDQLRWASARPAGMPAFVRKGTIGDWRNHFRPDQARRLLDRLNATPTLAGLWPEVVATVERFVDEGA